MLLLGLQSAGYDAVAVGEDEPAPGLLRSLAEGAGIRLVEGDPAKEAGWVATLGGPKAPFRVGVAVAPGGGAGTAAKASGDCRLRVLITPGGIEEAERIAQRTAEPCVVVANGEAAADPRYRSVGSTRLAVSPGRYGHYVTDVAVTLEGGRPVRLMPSFTCLDASITSADVGRQIVDAYQARLREEKLVGRAPRLPLAAGERYAGSKPCASCHPEAQRTWAASRHASALRDLEPKGRQHDPDCVACHVTGFPVAGGYATPEAAPGLDAVGCEACHGPAGQHAADPGVRPGRRAAAACDGCHTAEHSPGFAMDAYLRKVRHWR